MKYKIPFVIKWLDYILALLCISILVFLLILFELSSDDAVGYYILFAFISLPLFISFKIFGANEAWLRVSKKIQTNDPSIAFIYSETLLQETYLEVTLEMNVPHTYSEFRGGDRTQRLTSRNFHQTNRVSLSGIYEKLSEHEFYCNQQDRVEALSLYTPEVLQLLTDSKAECAIETLDNKLMIFSYPSYFVDEQKYQDLINLTKIFTSQINERARSFNRENKSFEHMPYRNLGFYLTNFTDQAKLVILATTAMAVLSLMYAADSGSGRVIYPALNLPDWLGSILFSYILLSPVLIIIAILNLQKLTVSIRKPVRTIKIGSTHVSRGVAIYFIFMAVIFSVLLLSATDTVR